LNNNKITIFNKNFNDIFEDVKKSSFVYFDPPYDPISKGSNFTGYTQGGFDRDNQTQLRDLCNELNKRRVKFLLSNSATPFIEDLYKEYEINYVNAKRAINSNGKKRGDVSELLIRNYE